MDANTGILRKIVYTCAIIFAVQLGVFVVMLRPSTFYIWAGLAVMAILCLYLVRIALLLLDELDKRDRGE